MEFKKGDFVRVVETGEEGFVVEVESSGDVKVVGTNVYGYFEKNEVEPTENNKNNTIYNLTGSLGYHYSELKRFIIEKYPFNPNIENLKLVDAIKVRGGEKSWIFKDKYIETIYGLANDVYNDDLTHKTNPNMDIVAVYVSYDSCGVESDDLEDMYMMLPLWER